MAPAQSRLLSLPTEIRLSIYDATEMCATIRLVALKCASGDEDSVVLSRAALDSSAAQSLACFPSLALVNHHVNEEIVGHFFANTLFKIRLPNNGYHFLRPAYTNGGHMTRITCGRSPVPPSPTSLSQGVSVPKSVLQHMRIVTLLQPAFRVWSGRSQHVFSGEFGLRVSRAGKLESVRVSLAETANESDQALEISEMGQMTGAMRTVLEEQLGKKVMGAEQDCRRETNALLAALLAVKNLCFENLHLEGETLALHENPRDWEAVARYQRKKTWGDRCLCQ